MRIKINEKVFWEDQQKDIFIKTNQAMDLFND